jgi:predicted DCC family thiol-disulfide oxidoreductase YuxK
LLAAHGRPTDQLDSVVLVERGQAYERSTAVLRILRRLPLPWSLLYGWIAVPAGVRDAVYDCVAHWRHGRSRNLPCVMPMDSLARRKTT